MFGIKLGLVLNSNLGTRITFCCYLHPLAAVSVADSNLDKFWSRSIIRYECLNIVNIGITVTKITLYVESPRKTQLNVRWVTVFFNSVQLFVNSWNQVQKHVKPTIFFCNKTTMNWCSFYFLLFSLCFYVQEIWTFLVISLK